MKKLSLFATGVIFALASHSVMAEEEVVPHAYVAPSFGKYFFDNDRDIEDDYLYSLDFGYQINSNLAVQLGFGKINNTENPGLDNNIDAKWYHLDSMYYIAPVGKWKPYALASAAHMRIDPSDAGTDDETLLGLGVGVERELTDRVALRADVRDYYSLDNETHDQAVMLSVKLALGETKRAIVRKEPPPPAPQPKEIYVDKPVSIRLNIEFDFDKSVIKPEYYPELEKVASFLQRYSNIHVTIEGHTDSVGNDAYNLMLSQSRSDAVRQALIEQYNIQPGRLTAIGKGESEPVADNGSPEGRQRNRRVMANIKAVEKVKKVITE
ncbi:OmpA family protein [Zooshikella harenae]|uniref:OmpA family protein n=1 Tax=Zooshikella harenae TaxID=2827238 RepID=A0ABS5ZAU9_9GAMM|nr:OmpA family protein [Zooshikella harenae]MBU2711013.1 OmpA family protein [Zooshikella harenae]